MMEKVPLTIDGLEVVVDKGTSILEVALRNNIYIPHLCYYPDLEARGTCRLCIVEINDGELITSCRMPVESGMVVKTKSPKIEKLIRPVVELLIADHHASCAGCPSSGHCELQKIMTYLRIDRRRVRRLRLAKVEAPLDTTNPCFDYDANRCVLCGMCVQTCDHVQGISSFYFVGRGHSTKVGFYGDKPKCESCKQCMVRCPVGALISKTAMQ